MTHPSKRKGDKATLRPAAFETLTFDQFIYADPRCGRDQIAKLLNAGVPEIWRVTDDGRELVTYPTRVEVSVSPTGRSVMVWVNGDRVA